MGRLLINVLLAACAGLATLWGCAWVAFALIVLMGGSPGSRSAASAFALLGALGFVVARIASRERQRLDSADEAPRGFDVMIRSDVAIPVEPPQAAAPEPGDLPPRSRDNPGAPTLRL